MSITTLKSSLPDWFNDLHFAFSSKSDGQMSFKRGEPNVVADSRRRFLSKQGLDLNSVAAGELTHGSEIAFVTSEEKGRGSASPDWICSVDGLVTDEADLLLLTTHADCAPLIMYDPIGRVLGQAHAGWRGLRSGIIERLTETILSKSGNPVSSLKCWLGPTIRACCYPVSVDVAEQFPSECRVIAGDEIRLDLVMFVKMELRRLEFAPANVADCNICTSCSDEFSSFRRDSQDVAAMACVSGMK